MTARGRKRAEVEPVASTVDLRHGRWQDVLGDVAKVGTVLCDPPYGARTHAGALQGGEMADGRTLNLTDASRGGDGSARTPISYDHWTPADVAEFVGAWAPRTERWIVAMTSHDLLPAWSAAFASAGWYEFAPLAVVIAGMGVRVLADGPANWTIHLAIARRRARSLGGKAGSIWRSLPGGYTGPMGPHQAGGRGKPPWLLDALVRDYSDPGHVVCDPFAGWGGTLVAARNAGRVAIGAEMDAEAHAIATAHLSGDRVAFERLIAFGRPMRPIASDEQPSLFGGVA